MEGVFQGTQYYRVTFTNYLTNGERIARAGITKELAMTLKHLFSQGLGILALVCVINGLTVTSVSAIPYDYTVTGTVTGTFNADLSVPGGSFNSWTLTTPTDTFTNLTGTTWYNANFSLLQSLGTSALAFFIVPPAYDSYVGAYSGNNAAGTFYGSFVRASVPEPSSISLMLAGLLALAGMSWMHSARGKGMI